MKKELITIIVFFIIGTSLFAQKKTNFDFKLIDNDDAAFGVNTKLFDGDDEIDLTFPFFPLLRFQPRNFAFGPTLVMTNENFPIDFRFQIPIRNNAFLVHNLNSSSATLHTITGISPTLDLKIKLGKYNKKQIRPTVLIGCSYDIGIRYRQKVGTFDIFKQIWKYPKTVNEDINNLNSKGLDMRIGIGIDRKKDGYLNSFSIVYRHKLYNLFNTNYVDENGNKPYENYETTWGTISFVYTTNMPFKERIKKRSTKRE